MQRKSISTNRKCPNSGITWQPIFPCCPAWSRWQAHLPEMLAPVFPMNLIEQEVSTERWISIPDEVQDMLKIWRPSPLIRAFELEKALGTLRRSFTKRVSPCR